MADSSTEKKESILPDPEQIKKLFESWWQTGSSIFATLLAALTALQIPSPWARAIALAAVVIGLTASIVVYRWQRKRSQTAVRDTAPVLDGSQQTGAAFRGLRRFRRGEVLPGQQRRQEAAQLLSEVLQPSFQVGVVTGDSGAGKSSLLESAVASGL
jgi:hypothetical protein